jgi:pimeloyl-ACP methyl ester carboxylesterase
MSKIRVNDVELHHEVQGSGPPLVLVHGGWADHTSWTELAARLATEFRVVSYDRRGYSRSERPAQGWTRRDSEDDLAAMIETVAGAPAYVVGNSFGGLITLALAARRPELLRAFAVHEPPATSVADGGELARLVEEAVGSVDTVLEEIQAGAVGRATRRFMEHVALGPGSWELLPEELQAVFVGNAPAVATELLQPDWSDLDIQALDRTGHQPLLTKGDAAPLWLQRTVDRLAELIPSATKATIPGAGHAPHMTHPDEYAALLSGFFAHPAAIAA